jgi:hypothetical protein
VLQEERAHAGEVGRTRGGEHLCAGWRQDREGAAGVARARLPADQALALQAVGQAREARAAEDDRRREVAHPHAPVLGVVEIEQDLVGAQRQSVSGVEVGVQRLGQRRMGTQHAAPGAQLALVELTGVGERGCRGGGGHREEPLCVQLP